MQGDKNMPAVCIEVHLFVLPPHTHTHTTKLGQAQSVLPFDIPLGHHPISGQAISIHEQVDICFGQGSISEILAASLGDVLQIFTIMERGSGAVIRHQRSEPDLAQQEALIQSGAGI